jgi:integrase
MVKNNIIYLKQNKTQKVVQIPLNKWALELLPGYNFNTISNQRTNANLKCLAYLLKIDHLTCHIARHTFGTMCLNKGIGIDTVAEIMGHSNTNVTKIYAKMLPTFKVQEMQKWG